MGEMRAFGGGGGAASGGADKGPQLDELLKALKEQGNLQIGQNYVQFSTKLCLKRCVKKPDAKFSAHERKCIENCTARFLDASEIVSDSLVDFQRDVAHAHNV